MKKQIFILFLLASITMNAQHTGKVLVENVSGNIYKVYLDSKPHSPIYPYPDSAAFWLGVVCPNGQYESHQSGWQDTFYYEITGKASFASSIYWFKNGVQVGRNDMEAPEVHNGNSQQCYKFLGIHKFYVPVIAPPLPPPVLPGITVNNWLIESNSPGTLLVFDSGFSGVHHMKTYDTMFSYQLDSGTWWVQCIWPDGSFTPMTEYIVP